MFHEVSICKKLTYINNISHRSGSDLKKSYVPLGQQIIRWEHIPTIRTDAEASSNGQEIACEKSKYNRGKSRLYIDRKKESAHWCGFFVCKKGGKEKEMRQFFTFFLSYDWFGFRQKKKKQQRKRLIRKKRRAKRKQNSLWKRQRYRRKRAKNGLVL